MRRVSALLLCLALFLPKAALCASICGVDDDVEHASPGDAEVHTPCHEGMEVAGTDPPPDPDAPCTDCDVHDGLGAPVGTTPDVVSPVEDSRSLVTPLRTARLGSASAEPPPRASAPARPPPGAARNTPLLI